MPNAHDHLRSEPERKEYAAHQRAPVLLDVIRGLAVS